MHRYTEIGWGNPTPISTEIEATNGEQRIPGFHLAKRLKSVYLRIWLGRKVVIIDSREGIKTQTKQHKATKILIGIHSQD